MVVDDNPWIFDERCERLARELLKDIEANHVKDAIHSLTWAIQYAVEEWCDDVKVKIRARQDLS